MSRLLLVILFQLALIIASAHAAPESSSGVRDPADTGQARIRRLIVRFKDENRLGDLSAPSGMVADPVVGFAARTRVSMKRLHQLSASMHAVALDRPMTLIEFESAMGVLRADRAVLTVEPDRMMRRHAVTPNDPGYADAAYNSAQPIGQWHLKANSGEVKSAINAAGAWEYSRGSSAVVIAVLDTGVRFDHPDLQRVASQGRLLPGYDFVSADQDSHGRFVTANDGDGRDADASDPGDWVDDQYLVNFPPFIGCTKEDSSWHGTRVAGIIGAMTDNGVGIAGIDWNASILPVRVLGRCGGYLSDILAGIRWAAGLSVQGVPDNPNPARIINLSLGGTASKCTPDEQSVIDEVTASGVLVVASAGNQNGPVADPANCNGVLAVAGLRHVGTKVGYSSMGGEVGISAPAGNCVTTSLGEPCLYSIDTTTNDSTTVPGSNTYTSQFVFNVGTSFSAPLVSGVAALMLSVNGALTPAQLIDKLRRSARPFPTDPTLLTCPDVVGTGKVGEGQCNCTTSQCGAGMLDALGAVELALPTPTTPSISTATAVGTDQVKLAWTSATDVVGASAYKVYRDGVLIATLGNVTQYEDSGLAASTSYSYSVSACNVVNACSVQSASVSVTTPSAVAVLHAGAGWNLLGNGTSAAIDVVAAFGDAALVATVWKWGAASANWAFYSPSMTPQALADYAASTGYDVLTSINGGEGFWINANQPFTKSVPAGSMVASDSFQEGKPNALKLGWNLISIGSVQSPGDFNRDLAATSLASGATPVNIATLWAWDNPLSKWYFYAPSFEALDGTALTIYTASKGFLDFTSSNKMLGEGTGFWLNRQ